MLGACSKEDAPPKLTVLSPQSNDFVATNSELEIKVRCSDDIALKKLTVFIKNEELSQIFTSVSHLFNDEKEQEVTLAIDFSELLLPGGTYYFHLSLRDEEQHTSAFIPFQYAGTPRKRTHVVLLSAEQGVNKLYAKTDSSESLLYQTQPARQFNLSGSTEAQKFAIQDVFQEGVLVYDTDYQLLQELNPYRQAPERSFNHISYTEDKLWVCYDNGRISQYSRSGSEIRQINLANGLHPYYAKQIEDKLFVYAKDPVNQQEKLLLFLPSTGGGLGEKSLDTDGFIGVYPNGTDQFLLVYQKGNDVQIQDLYYPSLGGLVVEQIFNAEVFACADEQLLWIATNTGLYSFQYSNNNLLLRDASVFQNLWLDERAGQLWGCIGNKVQMRELGGLVVEEEIIVPTADSLLSAVGLYNY